MQDLAFEDGSVPSAYHAPSSVFLHKEVKKQLQGRDVAPPPTADEREWDAICNGALQALEEGQRACITLPAGMVLADGEEALPVHADAQLMNTMARRSQERGTG
jgi:hypothetical protein